MNPDSYRDNGSSSQSKIIINRQEKITNNFYTTLIILVCHPGKGGIYYARRTHKFNSCVVMPIYN